MTPCPHHSACQAETLAHAEAICTRRKLRLTPLRRRVLELISASHAAVKAYDLIAKLSTEDHRVKPPTVYRSLDFLLENGLIHRVDSLNAFVSCSHPHETHEVRLLICQQCGDIQELSSPMLDQALRHALAQTSFTAQNTHLEIHGLCATCQQITL